MRLHIVLGLSVFNIVDHKSALIVNHTHVPGGDGGGLESSRFYSMRLREVFHLIQLSSFELVDLENTLGAWRLSENAESSGCRNPLAVERSEGTLSGLML